MKKLLCIILTTIMLLGVLTSCSKDPNTSSTQQTESSESTSDENSNEDSSSNDNINPTDLNLEKTEISNLYKMTTDSVEYQTNILVETTIQNDIACIEYVSTGLDSASEKVTFFSIKENKIINTIELEEGSWATGRTGENGFYTYNSNKKVLYLYDETGKETNQIDLELPEVYYLDQFALSPDLKKAAYNNPETNNIILIDLETKETTTAYTNTISLNNLKYVKYNNGFYFTDCNQYLIFINENGNANETKLNAKISSFSEYYGSQRNDESLIIVPFDTEEDAFKISCNEQDEMIASNKDYIATKLVNYETNEYTVNFYNLKDKLKLPAISLNSNIQTVTISDNNYAFIVAVDESTNSYEFYIYKLEDCKSIMSLIVSPIEINKAPETDWTDSQKILDIVNKISNDYGVRAFADYEHLSSDDMEKSFSFIYDKATEEVIYEKALAVYELLDYFPREMLDEIGKGSGIWIFLCENIRSSDESSSTVDGFASFYEEHPFIAINAKATNDYFKESLVHEISHLMDYKESYKSLEEWRNFLPDNIRDTCYLDSYAKLLNDFTPYSENPTNENVWFYNQYSRTYPTEDRAVIFQKMYESYVKGTLSENFKYDNVYKKAQLYCKIIRENFNSCRDNDNLKWEKLFEEEGGISCEF